MSRKTSVALWLFLAVGPLRVAAQGLPFHTPSALTTAFEERGVRVFSMVQSRGDVTSTVFPLVVLPFAPHERLTTTVKLPLTYKRMRDSGPHGPGEYRGNGTHCGQKTTNANPRTSTTAIQTAMTTTQTHGRGRRGPDERPGSVMCRKTSWTASTPTLSVSSGPVSR